jgi:hypothetical protein
MMKKEADALRAATRSLVRREGERLATIAFFDGERIEHCPGCGQRLAIHNLLTKRIP